MRPAVVLEQSLLRSCELMLHAAQLGGTVAQRVITRLASDLPGEEVVEGRTETIEFGYRGSSYSIDLTADEAGAFDEAMAAYVAHATDTGVPHGRATSTSGRSSARSGAALQGIRAWARDNGYEVAERGRLRTEIVDAYNAAH